MKGMIFTEFLDMVDEQFGLQVKHQIIRAARLGNDGAYTSVGNYQYEELLRLAESLSVASGKPLPDLLVAFGERIFDYFTLHYGHFFKASGGCFDFLGRIESYIHVEVRKLYQDAQLPMFRYPQHDAQQLIMEYQSPRPLAAFAEGLVRASIRHFGEPISLAVEDLSGGRGTQARFTLTRAPADG